MNFWQDNHAQDVAEEALLKKQCRKRFIAHVLLPGDVIVHVTDQTLLRTRL